MEIRLNNVEAEEAVNDYITTPKTKLSPASNMQVTMSSAVEQNPDEAAELKKISERTGVPFSSLKNPDVKKKVEKSEAFQSFDFDGFAELFPHSAQYLATPEFAAISHDDVDTIGGIETTVNVLNNSQKAIGSGLGWEGMSRLWGSFEWAAGFASDYVGQPFDTGLKLLGSDPNRDNDPFDNLQEFFGKRAADNRYLNREVMSEVVEGSGTVGRAAYSGLNSMGATLPGLVSAAVTRNPNLALGYAGASSFGGSASRGLEEGLDPLAAGIFGFKDATIEILTERIPVVKFVEDLTAGTGVGKTIVNSIVREVPGEMLATTLQNFNEWITLNPDKPFKTYLDALPADLRDTVIATITATGVQTGAISLGTKAFERATRQEQQALHAINQAQSLQDIADLAQASKTLQRDSESFEAWLEGMSDGREVTDIYLDPDELAQSGVDLESLAELSPSIAKQRDLAEGTGSLLKIPVPEFTAQLAASELSQTLIPLARTDPQGMSLNEAEEFMQSGLEDLEQEVELELTEDVAETERARPRRVVEENILQQLNNANRFTEDVNKPYAALIGNFYETIGERTGQTAEQAFQQFPVNIQAEGVEGPVLNQDVETTETPEFKNWFGESQVKDESGAPIVVHHGGFEAGQITEFSADFGGQTTGNNEHGAFHFVSDDRVSEDYARQSFIRRFEDRTEDLIEEGIVDTVPEFESYSDEQAFLEELADERAQIDQQAVYLKIENPVIIDMQGERVDVQQIENITRAAIQGYDETGELETFFDMQEVFSPDDINDFKDDIEQRARENYDLEADENIEDWQFEDATREIMEENYIEGEFNRPDGIIIKNMIDDIGERSREVADQYIVWDANQIKSVQNNGQFSEYDNDIFRQEQRGSFNVNTSTISLLQAADLSTFLHESGHFFLETLGTIAAQENAPEQIRQDMDAALEWMGVESLEDWQGRTLEEKREAHEQFARGFEAYLFEGNVPSVELQGIFQRFRAWLLNIYRDIRNLNVELTDEVRRVFDRMLATDNMIAEAEVVRGMRPMFDSAEDAGMSEQEWISYQELGAEATADAIENLDARSLRDMKWLGNARSRELKKLQRDAKQKRKTIRDEVTTEVMSEPVNQAYQFITRREYMIPDDVNKRQRRLATEIAQGEGSTKMSIESLKEFYGEQDTIWQDLPKGKYGLVAKEGMDFNAIGELFGYTSGDAMLQELIAREDPKEKIEGLTDQRMLERYGDISDPQALERAADAAIHNDARTRFVASEMAALQKATGGRKILASAAKSLAETMINRLRIRDIKPSRYTAAEARAARSADKARRSGDIDKAAVHKRNQLVQMYAAKAAIAAKEQNEKDLRYLKKFDREGSRKNIDTSYLDQIDAILDKFDLRKSTSLKAIDKRKSLADWLEEQAEIGIEPDLPPEVTDITFKKHYKDMSVEEMRGVVDSIKQIEHLGRLKNKLLTAKDKRQFNKVVEDLVESIEENYDGKIKDNTTRATAAGRVKQLFTGYLAQHRKVASLARQMDGVEDGGQMWEVFIRTMNEAGDTEASMREEATVKLAQMSEKIVALGKMGGKGVYFETLGRSLNREERISIVLNMGNEGNLQRLLDGKGWTLEQVQPVLDSLTAQEIEFVQEVWDLFESYRPQIGAKEKRIYGKEPEWVEPTPLETRHGTLRGGYYPIKYDVRQSAEAEQFDAAEAAKQQLRGAYTSATTRRSFTKTRADEVVDRPLLITMDALYGGLNEVIHDLAWHEWLIDANRLLRSKRLTRAILDTQGADKFKQLKEGVKDIAAGEMPSGGAFEKVSAHLRAGATVAGLGLSVSTSLINVTGLAQSFVRVGPRWVVQGLNEWAANPTTLVGNIYEKSEFMRLRGKTMQREINEIQSLLRDKTKTRQAIDTISFMPLVYTQVAVDTPTWWGAYQKALAEGNDEQRSVALADQAVIDAQGGGQVKDLAAIQRGSPLLKLWTTFYSYFSTTYQLTVEQTSKTNFKDPLDVLRLGGDYFMLYVIPAFLGSVIRGAISGDEEWAEPEKLAKAYANEQLSFAFGTMVGLRETTGFAQKALGVNEYFGGYNGPAGLRFFNELDRLGAQVGQGELDKALRKSLVNVAGVTMRLPSSQANRTIDGIVAVMEGETYNPASLVFGPPKD